MFACISNFVRFLGNCRSHLLRLHGPGCSWPQLVSSSPFSHECEGLPSPSTWPVPSPSTSSISPSSTTPSHYSLLSSSPWACALLLGSMRGWRCHRKLPFSSLESLPVSLPLPLPLFPQTPLPSLLYSHLTSFPGIGKVTAIRLLKEGFHVIGTVIVGSPPPSSLLSYLLGS